MSFQTLIAEIEQDISVLALSIQEREENDEDIDNDEYVYLTLLENTLEQIQNHME